MSSVFTWMCGDSKLEARLTPWDQRAFGFGTAEVTSVALEGSSGENCLKALQQWCSEADVSYCFGRHDANDRVTRESLAREGYSTVELSLKLRREGFVGLPVVPKGMAVMLKASMPEDLGVIREIAFRDFHHGRFLEDPGVPEALARGRTRQWIDALHEQGLLQTGWSQGGIIGFHAERISDDGRSCDLILTGARQGREVLAMPLWIAALKSLESRGVERCSTLVSAANTGIINLYARLGFTFTQSLHGFRKHL